VVPGYKCSVRALPAEYFFEVRVIIRLNSDYLHKQHQPNDFCEEMLCFIRDKDRIYEYYWVKFRFLALNTVQITFCRLNN
jgi:hypothetical protein